MMTYKINIDGVQTHQVNDYKQALNIILASEISDDSTLELYYENTLMFRIKGSLTALDMVRSFQKHLSQGECNEKV